MTTIQVYFDSGVQAFNCNNDIASWRSSEINRGTVHQVVKKKRGRHGLVKEDYWSIRERLCGGDLSGVPKNMQESLVEEQLGGRKGHSK